MSSLFQEKNLILLYSLVFVISNYQFVAVAYPQDVYGNKKPPDFADHQTKEVFDSKPAPINFKSHPRANTFRTMLSVNYEKGPNFAGHYTIATWGCGVACMELAIIDAKNGDVYFPPAVRLIEYHMVNENMARPVTFMRNSNLLIVKGLPNSDENEAGAYFYLWDELKLKKLYFEKTK